MNGALRLALFPLAVSAVLLGSASGATAGEAVPFKGSDSGVARIVRTSGDVIRTVDVATGHATHLGRYTLEGAEDVNVVTGRITHGSFLLIAANGDTLRGTYSGTARPGLTGYDVSGPITGGTGRFAGASGTLTWHGDFDPSTFTLSDEVTGTLVR
jgi:hypothetical protein